MNKLYYGDNLTVLRGCIDDESVDLVYLDPPFNSQATYNVLFKSTAGEQSRAQIEAFGDTWHWGDEAELAFDGVMSSGNSDAAEMLRAMRSFLKENDMMAYLAMMAVRLIELHRVLKSTGSLYLHCDPTASHYLKIVLDSIFHPEQYRSEIVWLRSRNPKGSQHKSVQWGGSTDTILFYSKSGETTLHIDRAKSISDADDIARHFPNTDAQGRWDDGPILRSDSMGPRPNLVYEYKGFTPGSAGWRVSREKLEIIDRAQQQPRKEALAEFLLEHGPMARSEIVANAGLPEGTISYCLADKRFFEQLPSGDWAATDFSRRGFEMRKLHPPLQA